MMQLLMDNPQGLTTGEFRRHGIAHPAGRKHELAEIFDIRSEPVKVSSRWGISVVARYRITRREARKVRSWLRRQTAAPAARAA